MQEKLHQRLQSLRAEYESGQKVLAELEVKQASVRDMLLRISGAIQVLEEMLAQGEDAASGDSNGAAGLPPVAASVGSTLPGEDGQL